MKIEGVLILVVGLLAALLVAWLVFAEALKSKRRRKHFSARLPRTNEFKSPPQQRPQLNSMTCGFCGEKITGRGEVISAQRVRELKQSGFRPKIAESVWLHEASRTTTDWVACDQCAILEIGVFEQKQQTKSHEMREQDLLQQPALVKELVDSILSDLNLIVSVGSNQRGAEIAKEAVKKMEQLSAFKAHAGLIRSAGALLWNPRFVRGSQELGTYLRMKELSSQNDLTSSAKSAIKFVQTWFSEYSAQHK